MISAILLAAGTSKRMEQGNKMLLPLNDKTVLETTLDNILANGPGEVIVVLGKDADQVMAHIDHLPVKVVFNENYERGMTSSIQKGLSVATGKGYMICLGDMVLITAPEYLRIKDAFEEIIQSDPQAICIPVYDQQKGNPVIFSSYYKESILRHDRAEGCREIVQANVLHIHSVLMPTSHILADIDTPADYQRMVELFA
jgi:molybdenum cofactor cytidylyltransferase